MRRGRCLLLTFSLVGVGAVARSAKAQSSLTFAGPSNSSCVNTTGNQFVLITQTCASTYTPISPFNGQPEPNEYISYSMFGLARAGGSYLNAAANASGTAVTSVANPGFLYSLNLSATATATTSGTLSLSRIVGLGSTVTPAMVRLYPFLEGTIGAGSSPGPGYRSAAFSSGAITINAAGQSDRYAETATDFGGPNSGTTTNIPPVSPLDVLFSAFVGNTLSYSLTMVAYSQLTIYEAAGSSGFGTADFRNTGGIGAVQILDGNNNDITADFVVRDASGTVYSDVTSSPEPESVLLVATGLVGLGGAMRYRKRALDRPGRQSAS